MVTATFGKTTIRLVQGDITKEAVDAIVNAANERLVGGGGVDGAIHRAGGPQIMAECDQIRAKHGGCPTGSAVATTAGKLPAKMVIHTVGPVWSERSAVECDRLLASAYTSSLTLAWENRLRTVDFPSISTGVYGFPIERAAKLVLATVRSFVQHHPFEEIRFVLFSAADFAIYELALAQLSKGPT
jgi:O-acetyl-ADP-ribose deacetylase (regulator of RNase III)